MLALADHSSTINVHCIYSTRERWRPLVNKPVPSNLFRVARWQRPRNLHMLPDQATLDVLDVGVQDH